MRVYRELLRNRSFLFLWLAGAMSNIGDFFNSVALIKLLSENPERLGTYVALVTVAKVLPQILFGTVAGVLADRFSRKRIMVAADLLRAVLVLGLVFVSEPWQIISLVAASSVVAAFFNPASNALLPSLVTREQLVTAGALGVMTQRSAMLLGMGLGSAVLGVVGPHAVFLIDSASFLVSALLVAGIVAPAAARPAHPSDEGTAAPRLGAWTRFRGDLAETLAFLRENPPVRQFFSVFAFAAVGDSGLNVLLVTFFTVALGIAAENLGYVWALFGAASVAGALALGAWGSKIPWYRIVTFSSFYVWATIMGALLWSSPIPSVALMTLMGLGSGAVNVAVQAAVGQLVPNQVRGRIFGVWGMMQSLIYIVGVMVAGILSDRLGPTTTTMIFVTAFLAGGIYAVITFRTPPVPTAVVEPTSSSAN